MTLVLVACGSSTKIASNDFVKPEAIKKHLDFLASDDLHGRNTGTADIEKAAGYISAQFKTMGVKPYFDTYKDNFDAKGKPAFNVVGVLEGNDPELKKEFILIGAHYDHIGTAKEIDGDTIANGANDNASGTSSVIEIARYFAEAKTNKRSLIFALFSAEEMGLLGSRHLAEKLKDEDLNLYLMFNIEMVGVPMVDKDYLVYLTGYEMSNLAETFNAFCDKKVIGFLPQAKEYNLFNRSDNAAFYEEFNLPAHTVSTFDFTNFDNYHGVNDEVDKMDPAHMANVVNNLLPGIEGLATSPQETVKLNE